jgi:transcriptional regulator with XRE-family HTH domain
MEHLIQLAENLSVLQSGLGARIRAHRKRAHLSQQELAERAGLHRGTIADLERARRDNVCLSTAWRIALALGLEDVSHLTAPSRPCLEDVLAPSPIRTAEPVNPQGAGHV